MTKKCRRFIATLTSTIYWKEHCLLTDKDIGLFFGFVGVMSILWQGIALKWILKRWHEHQIIKVVSLLMSAAFFGLIFLNASNVFYGMFVLLFFISMGNGLISPSITSLLSQQVSSESTGALLGVFQSLGSLARTVAPSVGGFLYDIKYSYPFVLASVIMMSSVVLIYSIKQKLNNNG